MTETLRDNPPAALPDFADPDACFTYLASLPLARIDDAHDAIAVMLEALLASPPPALNHLEVLEAARPTISYLQGELAHRFAGCALPPDPAADSAFRRFIRIWLAMERNYNCVAATPDPSPELLERQPTLAQRRLASCGSAIFGYYACRREVPESLWRSLLSHYADVESKGLAGLSVRDSLNEVDGRSSVGAVLATVLLISVANPYALSRDQLEWVARWAERFGALSRVRRRTGDDSRTAFGVDLASSSSPSPLSRLADSETIRVLDTEQIRASLREARERLKEDVSPTALGLGGGLSSQAARRLLLKVYRQWHSGGMSRRFPRRPSEAEMHVVMGLSAIAERLDGDRPNMRNGGQPDACEFSGAGDDSAVRETWRVVNHSASGFQAQRWLEGQPVRPRSLACIVPPGGSTASLARISWCRLDQGGTISAGFQSLAGHPILSRGRRAFSDAVKGARTFPAILLVPPGEAERRLVLPKGIYVEALELELRTQTEVMAVRLGQVSVSGADFDCVYYAAA